MNGRIYDPTLGRFLQADPHIQAPMNSQNYNRYSYVLNNPMSYTDPSGYFFDKLFKGLNKALGDFAPFVAIGVMFIPGINMVAAGFIAGGISTGSLKGAMVGAFTAGLGLASGGNALVAAFGGGMSSVMMGGKFEHGFISAGLGGLAAPGLAGVSNPVARMVTSAVVGGTISVITGGKFRNGAYSAAFAAALYADWSQGKEIRHNTGVSESRLDQKTDIDNALERINAQKDSLNRTGFANTDEAAKALDSLAGNITDSELNLIDVEVGAKFYANESGTVLIGEVVTNYESGWVDIGQSYHPYFNKVVGEWHTHGTNPLYYDFSGSDLSNSNRVPVYLSAPNFGTSYTGQHLLRSYQGTTCTMSGRSTLYGGC